MDTPYDVEQLNAIIKNRRSITPVLFERGKKNCR